MAKTTERAIFLVSFSLLLFYEKCHNMHWENVRAVMSTSYFNWLNISPDKVQNFKQADTDPAVATLTSRVYGLLDDSFST